MPPMRRRQSRMISTFAASWASYLSCWKSQPPQRPKYGHGGSMRWVEGSRTSTIDANATFPFTRSIRTRKRSPGADSATMIVRPSACAKPMPPGKIRSTETSRTSGWLAGLESIAANFPLAILMLRQFCFKVARHGSLNATSKDALERGATILCSDRRFKNFLKALGHATL